jgi:hypothetical protein
MMKIGHGILFYWRLPRQQDEQEQENKLIIVAEKNLELSASWSR